MENPSFKEKKLYTKTLFALNFVLAMVVSERVLEKQFQGLFKVAHIILKFYQTRHKCTSKFIIFIYSQVWTPFETNSTSETGKQNRQGPYR